MMMLDGFWAKGSVWAEFLGRFWRPGNLWILLIPYLEANYMRLQTTVHLGLLFAQLDLGQPNIWRTLTSVCWKQNDNTSHQPSSDGSNCSVPHLL
jgi:hypothetical protein